MLVMLAQRENVEIVRDICEWLVGVYRSDLKQTALQKGASEEQARIVANDGSANARAVAESISDRNAVEASKRVVDLVLQRYFNAGQEKYAEAQLWFANELRKRFKNDNER